MTDYYINIIISIVLLLVVINFSKPAATFFEKFDKSPKGGTGTDLYFVTFLLIVILLSGFFGYNLACLLF